MLTNLEMTGSPRTQGVWIAVLAFCAGVLLLGHDVMAAPLVTLVHASPDGDRKQVTVTYRVTDPAAPTVYVTMQVSSNNGASWTVPALTFAPNSAIGPGIPANGSAQTIVWKAGKDWDGNYSENMRVRVTADTVPMEGDFLVIDLSGGPSASSYPVSYLDAMPPGGWIDEHKTTKLVMRRIPAGSFAMGSPTGELGHSSDETQHQVSLTKDFYVGVFEVTQKQWERVMGDWPSYFNNTTYRDSRPLELRSWNDIRGGTWPGGQPASGTFMQRISSRTGFAFDLPTESQWEYACRAGTTTALNSGKNLTATGSCPNMSVVGRYWYNGGSGHSQRVDTSGGTAKAGSYLPNQWGLYDMHGNVGEWCLDWYGTYPGSVQDPGGAASGSNRVGRGGSWYSNAWDCRSAFRGSRNPGYRGIIYGFRLSRTLP